MFRPFNATLWFYAKIAGHSDLAYADALQVFESVQIAEFFSE